MGEVSDKRTQHSIKHNRTVKKNYEVDERMKGNYNRGHQDREEWQSKNLREGRKEGTPVECRY